MMRSACCGALGSLAGAGAGAEVVQRPKLASRSGNTLAGVTSPTTMSAALRG